MIDGRCAIKNQLPTAIIHLALSKYVGLSQATMLTPTGLIHTRRLNFVIPGSTDALAHSDATT